MTNQWENNKQVRLGASLGWVSCKFVITTVKKLISVLLLNNMVLETKVTVCMFPSITLTVTRSIIISQTDHFSANDVFQHNSMLLEL